MDVKKILNEFGISTYISLTEVNGGKDCKVFKVTISDGSSLALRIQQADRYHQFLYEKSIKELAMEKGLPVPLVYSVIVSESYAAMLMDWMPGVTVLQKLWEQPAIANQLGLEFGKMHATIHQILVPDSLDIITPNWLTPSDKEKQLVEHLPPSKSCLIHLDFHPLNVLTDGKKITGVIDWTNAAIGDPRFDYARTLSILQLDGYSLFKENLLTIKDFEEGWKTGYESIIGSYDDLPEYYIWAGTRMQRDRGQSLEMEHKNNIDRWINGWVMQL